MRSTGKGTEANPSSSRPIISSRCFTASDTSGLSELAVQGLAVAVPVDAPPRALAEVLAEVARRSDPIVPNLPTWDDCVDEILSLYDQILSDGSSERETR